MQTCSNCGYENPADLHICLNCASALGQKCPFCGHVVPAGNKFCSSCGKQLPHICKTCQAEIPVGYKFCGQCGTPVVEEPISGLGTPPIPEKHISRQDRMLQELQGRMPASLTNRIARAAPEVIGQRREVTVLFIYVANFASASQFLDSEDIYLIQDEMMQLLVDVIYKYEGTVDKFTGDGLFALFGLPLNHENDPERAVRAALETFSVIEPLQKRLKEKHQFEFKIQIGVNTGLVIAGNLGSQHHMEYTVIGDTVNLASRLEDSAEPGTALVSFRTYQRTRPIFEYQSIPPIQLKGFSDPVQVFRPLGLRVKPGRIRGLPGLQVPMVGRREHLKRITETFDEVRDSKSDRIVLISGEAGLGKTRLIAEVRQALKLQNVNMFQGTCASYMRITPYRVVADVIRDMVQVSEVEPEDIQREALNQHIRELGLDHQDVFPYLLHALGISQVDPIIETRLKLLNPTMLLHQTHSALRSFIIGVAQKTPSVIVFDDLHWVDPASRDFLEYLIQAIEHVPILLVLIARDFNQTIIQSLVEELQKRTGEMLEIHLSPLSNPETIQLVNQLLQEETPEADDLKKHIANRASGNPYYVEELIRILMDHGGLIRESGVWRVTELASELLGEVPGTLQDIILARFDRLSDTLRKTLQNASVLGRSFVINLLDAISEGPTEDLLNELQILEERDFLVKAQFGIDQGYTFKHPLLRETIYNTLLKRDLHSIHFRVAQTIEKGDYWLPGGQSEILAYHYSESSKPLQAIPHLILAANNASDRFANETAAEYFRKALSLMDKSPDIQKEVYREARIGLGKALKFSGEFDEATEVLESAVRNLLTIEEDVKEEKPEHIFTLIDGLRELADIRSREGALDVAAGVLQVGINLLGPSGHEQFPKLWRRLVDRIAWVYFRQGKLEESFSLADLALLDVNIWDTDDPITIASLNNTLGGIYWMRSRYVEAIEYVEHSLAIYKNLNYYWGMAIAYTNLGVLHHSQGNWQQAVESLEHADALRRDYGYTPERPTNLKNLGEVLIDLGDHERARSKLETSRDISLRLGMNLASVYAEFGLCRLAIIEGNYQDALLHLDKAKSRLEDYQEEVDDRTFNILNLESRIEGEIGNLERGIKLAHRAYNVADEGGFGSEKTEALTVLGILHGKGGAYEQAETYLKKASEMAQNQGDRYRYAQALYELGKLYFEESFKDSDNQMMWQSQALDNANHAIELFENLGAKHDFEVGLELRNKIPFDGGFYSLPYATAESQTQISALRLRLGMPEGEWYQAAILYVRLIPELSVDEEFIFETITLLMPPLIEIIHKNDGQLIRRQDGLTVVFGAPHAQEDDPIRAVDTAMQMLNFYQELHNQTQLPVNIKLGVTMGKIVAGHVGIEPGGEFLAAGEPINQAEIITDAAPLATIWVTQPIRNVTLSQFEYISASSELSVYLPGETVFQLKGLREQMGPVRGIIGLKSPFVGRRREVEALNAMSQVLSQGLGGVVWLEGNPGIGKSRLMREFAESMTDQGMQVWYGTCMPRRGEFAFSLFSDMLSQAFDLQPNMPPEKIYDRIEQKIQTWPTIASEVRPYVHLLLGLEPVGAHGEQLLALEPEQLRRQTFVTLRKFIATLSTERPLVLMLDDLQWIDPISADLLLFLINLIQTSSLLIVGAQRSTEKSASESILERAQSMHPERTVRVSVQPLTMEECQILLDQFLSETMIPDNVINLIVQQSGGNPYFIEEFVRMLLEQGFLRMNRGKLEVNQSFEIDSLTIPSSLETLIRARVDSLPAQSKRLLQIASVIGQKFSENLLAWVSMQMSLPSGLEVLQDRGMLRRSVEEEHWQFSHPLIETIVYNSVLRAQRSILHSRTAKALELQWKGSEADHAEDLAYHFGRAGENEKALHYLIIAGDRAASRYANEEALSHYQQASKLVNLIPETSDELRWRIASGLGDVYQFIGNFDASIAALQSGLPLISSEQLSKAQRASLYRRLGETTHKKGDLELSIKYFEEALDELGVPKKPQDYVEAARALARQGWSYFLQGNLEHALKAGLEAHGHAERSGNLNALAVVENLLGGVYYRQGELSQALEQTHQAMTLYEELGYDWGVASSMSNVGILEVALGNWDEALTFFQKSLALRQDMGDVEGVCIAYYNLGELALDRGDSEDAESYFRDSLAVARPFQIAFHIANSMNGLARALLYEEDLDGTEKAIEEGIQVAEEIGAQDTISEFHVTRGELLLARKMYHEGIEVAVHAAELASEIGNPVMESRAWRIVSECLNNRGDSNEAKEMLKKSWKALEGGSDELESGRIHALAGVIDMSLGNQDQAEEHFFTAEEIFSRLGAKRDLRYLHSKQVR